MGEQPVGGTRIVGRTGGRPQGRWKGASLNLTLVFFKDDGTRRDLPVKGDDVVLGRGEQVQLRIPLPTVSREHCRIRQDNGAILVRDLGSSNGTFINGEKLTGEETLTAGDRLTLGSVTLTAVVNGEPEEVEPPIRQMEQSKTPSAPDDTDPEDVQTPTRDSSHSDSNDDDIADLIAQAAKDESSVFDFDIDLDDDDKS